MGSNGRAAVSAGVASSMTERRRRLPLRRTPGTTSPERNGPRAAGAPRGRQRAPAQATEEVLVLDFGGQYSQLIARRIRECGVFSELLPHDSDIERISERGPRGLVLSGDRRRSTPRRARRSAPELLELGIPVLGICYGMQVMVHDLGGRVEGAGGRVRPQPSLPSRDGGGQPCSTACLPSSNAG